jgi:hypothetical protein
MYACNLPNLYGYSNKWKNIFKWLTYLNDFDEHFAVEFVLIIKDHISNEV